MGVLAVNDDVREHILEVAHDELLLGIVFRLLGQYLALKELPLDGRDVPERPLLIPRPCAHQPGSNGGSFRLTQAIA